MKKGFVNLLAVIFLAFLGVILITLLQMRVLLGIERTRSFSDTIVNTYAAESEITDLLARFLEQYPVPLTQQQKILVDGTVLSISPKNENGNTIIDVLAKRPYSSLKLELTKEGTATTVDRTTDIVLSLDCTGSMAYCADNTTDPSCSNPTSTRPTSLEELKKGTIAFLQSLDALHSSRIRVGISLFTLDANWLTTKTGTPIMPDKNLTIPEIIATIQESFGKTPSKSRACSLVSAGNTAIGSGLSFINTYFSGTKKVDTQQIQLLITDGEPNSVVPDGACHETYLIPGYADIIRNTKFCPTMTPASDPAVRWSCEPFVSRVGTTTYQYAYGSVDPTHDAFAHSKQQLRCQLADQKTPWNGTDMGQRDPSQDSYIVTTFPLAKNNEVRQIFELYSSGYFGMDNATQLSDTLLSKVLPQIQSSMNAFTIKKVSP